jgi:hypothetical protein
MASTTTDSTIEAKLRARALARWENEGGRVPLKMPPAPPPTRTTETFPDSAASSDAEGHQERSPR